MFFLYFIFLDGNAPIFCISYYAGFCRLDSLVGLFGAGCQPSSSSDPFGLRRISYGLVCYIVLYVKLFSLWSNDSRIIYIYTFFFCVGPTVGGKQQKLGFKTCFGACCCCPTHRSRCQNNRWCKIFIHLKMFVVILNQLKLKVLCCLDEPFGKFNMAFSFNCCIQIRRHNWMFIMQWQPNHLSPFYIPMNMECLDGYKLLLSKLSLYSN